MSGCARKELQNVVLYPYMLSSCIALYSEFTETSGAVGICLSHGNLTGKAVRLYYVRKKQDFRGKAQEIQK